MKPYAERNPRSPATGLRASNPPPGMSEYPFVSCRYSNAPAVHAVTVMYMVALASASTQMEGSFRMETCVCQVLLEAAGSFS